MISVIIPLYNKEQVIERTLRSVLSQDYDDFEVVVVDDGSTDNSLSIAQSIRKENENTLNIIQQPNGGPSKARNTGVKNARGEWIVFLDADDELLPGALKRFAMMVKEHPNVEFFNCPFFTYDGKEKKQMGFYKNSVLRNPFKEHALGKLIPRAGTMLVSKRLMEKFPFNERLKRFEDLENLLKLYSESNVYCSSAPSMIVNCKYAQASKHIYKIEDDFIGYLSLEGKSFWEQMCVYKIFIEQRTIYYKDCKRLYPNFYKKWRLYIVYQLFSKFKIFL